MKVLGIVLGFLLSSCQSEGHKFEPTENLETSIELDYQKLDTATLAGGCFWCVEASFEQIEGIIEAVSGYSGGKASTADYRMVSSGATKHAEAVQIYYDPSIIDYETILDIFFIAHDPTQLNRQGPDIGTQYRSEIFYHNDEQQKLAKSKIKELQTNFETRIVTEISELDVFYIAEEYHQNYEKKHPNNSYILNVSKPKIDKVAKTFKDRLKT
ncbi:MAG: peptide-methionine (S)-S-oxide reductase MsrA [Bacteroidota bacterium]